MAEGRWEWWRQHGAVIALLSVAFGIAFLVRTLWMWPLYLQYGAANLFGGGSDSFYHFRVSYYIVQNHKNLIFDPLLKYPVGAINPREPLFDWMNAILAILFAGAFGGNTYNSTAFFLEMGGPLWAALGVFPIYLIGREISNRRVGVVAAFLYAVAVANIDSSTFGYANYLAFYTFFILITIYAYLRTIKAVGSRRWVTSYRHPRDIVQGLRNWARTERSAFKWAVFTGVCFGALALAWQGFSLVVAAFVIFTVIALVIERIRRIDSFGLYVATWIVGLVGFPMALPYYYVQGLALNWFGLPLLVFAGGLLVALPLILLRDQPWIFSIPVFLLVAAAGIGALAVVNPTQFQNVITGQGYFVKTLIYSTVAEAQAPSIDSLIVGYGVATFFVAFVGLALWTWRAIRGRFPRVLLMAIVFALISIYLPISAAKFFFVGSAAFALLPAEALVRVLDIAQLPKLRRSISQLSDRGSQFAAFRKAFRPRHAVVLLAVVLCVTPNIWYAIDAGIPYNTKTTYNDQVYATLPPILQTSPSNASSFYLGAAGTELDTPPQYDEAGYNWLAQQDTNLPPAQRPAFISWWDYGFQAIAEGDHPSVADNFQNGIDPSGNFLLAQNESLAIGVLAATLILSEQQVSGQTDLPSAMNTLLAQDGVDLTTLHHLLSDPSYDIQLVEAHPDRYLPVDPTHLDGENAMYDTISWELASTRSLNGMADLYDDLQGYTHWTIRYAMVDDRLFPFSGQSTGIFYAPADLTDRVISSGGLPTTYFNVSITGSDGNTYPYGALPAGVSPTAYPITYYAPFYNSMLYRIFSGYNGTDIGEAAGIPQVSGSLGSSPAEPGWMLQHFEVVYRTAYYCPYSDPNAHPNCEVAMNLPEANLLAKASNGSVDDSMSTYASAGGESILAYYPGQTMTGAVVLPDGAAVPGVRVTVYDSFGIPHESVITGTNGVYSLVLPPGNDTVNVTSGSFNALTQAGTTVLQSINITVAPQYGYSLDAPALVRSVVLKPSTVTGIVYVNEAENDSYQPSIDPVAAGAVVHLAGPTGNYSATADASGGYLFSRIAPGEYNYTVTYQGATSSNSTLGPLYATAGQTTNRSYGIGPATVSGHVANPDGSPAVGAVVSVVGPTGVTVTATVDPEGNYSLPALSAGNSTVAATGVGGGLRTVPIAVDLTSGAHVFENLTLTQFGTVSLTVLSAGEPVSGYTVRFAPIVPFLTQPVNATPGNTTVTTPGSTGSTPTPGPNGTAPNGTTPPTTGNTSAPAKGPVRDYNSSVFVTGPDGTITGSLPVGNYSVYGLGLVDSTYASAFTEATVAPGFSTLPPISVSPALRLSGTIPAIQGGTGNASVEVVAYAADGASVWTYTNDSGAYGISLPAGEYTVLAVETPTVKDGPGYAALGSVNLSAPKSLTLSLTPAELYQPVFAASARGTAPTVPVAGAEVVLTAPALGLSMAERTNSSGNVTLWLPQSLPNGATYCVSAVDTGYSSIRTCDLPAGGLISQKYYHMAPANVTVTFHLTGLPGGSYASLNLSAGSGTLPTLLRAGATTSVSLAPGTYQVDGWMPGPTNVSIYQSAQTVNVTVPIGGPGPSTTVPFVRVVTATGLLTLAPGIGTANVSLTLAAPGYNRTLTGTAFTSHFLLPPGTYSVLANGYGDGSNHAAFVKVTFNATGVPNFPVNLRAEGSTVTVNLTLPGASLANTTFAGTIGAAGGLSIPVMFTDGRYSGVFPVGMPLNISVTTTQLVEGTTGAAFEHLTVPSPGPPCQPEGVSTTCPVLLLGAMVDSGFSGNLSIPGLPGSVAGTVTFIGPDGSTNRTTAATAANGTFSATLAPGTYLLYADAVEGSSAYANLTDVTVGASAVGPETIVLSTAWTASVLVRAPLGAPANASTTVTATGASGISLAFPGIAIGALTTIVLPAGSYNLSARLAGSPYGVPANATGSTNVALYVGNAAATIALAWQWQRTVAIHVPGTTYDLGDGGTATVAFSVVNTGNRPFSFHLVGSPVTYNFTFSPTNVTLGVGPTNDSISGTVTIVVPKGSAYAHPPIQLEAVVDAPIGGAAGFAEPAPTVNLTPIFKISGGAGSSASGSTAPFNISMPFYLANPGNAVDYVQLGLEDGVRLDGIGWSTTFSNGAGTISAPVTLTVGENSTFTLNLFANQAGALPPGSVTVVATVLNTSGAVAITIPISIPITSVGVNATGFGVTGPTVGSPSPYPSWLVPVLSFVPAAAFLVAVATYRWYRTRRWTRR